MNIVYLSWKFNTSRHSSPSNRNSVLCSPLAFEVWRASSSWSRDGANQSPDPRIYIYIHRSMIRPKPVYTQVHDQTQTYYTQVHDQTQTYIHRSMIKPKPIYTQVHDQIQTNIYLGPWSGPWTYIYTGPWSSPNLYSHKSKIRPKPIYTQVRDQDKPIYTKVHDQAQTYIYTGPWSGQTYIYISPWSGPNLYSHRSMIRPRPIYTSVHDQAQTRNEWQSDQARMKQERIAVCSEASPTSRWFTFIHVDLVDLAGCPHQTPVTQHVIHS